MIFRIYNVTYGNENGAKMSAKVAALDARDAIDQARVEWSLIMPETDGELISLEDFASSANGGCFISDDLRLTLEERGAEKRDDAINELRARLQAVQQTVEKIQAHHKVDYSATIAGIEKTLKATLIV